MIRQGIPNGPAQIATSPSRLALRLRPGGLTSAHPPLRADRRDDGFAMPYRGDWGAPASGVRERGTPGSGRSRLQLPSASTARSTASASGTDGLVRALSLPRPRPRRLPDRVVMLAARLARGPGLPGSPSWLPRPLAPACLRFYCLRGATTPVPQLPARQAARRAWRVRHRPAPGVRQGAGVARQCRPIRPALPP
jgi:hypothetical protein